MKKSKKGLVLILSLLLIVTICLTLSVSFSANTEEQVVRIKSIVASYDENSTLTNTTNSLNHKVTFNDKNQKIDYHVTIENTADYDVKVTDIVLGTLDTNFVKYEVKDLNKNDILKSKATKELIVSIETFKTEGWGLNFDQELITNIKFEKVTTSNSIDNNTAEENEDTEITEDKAPPFSSTEEVQQNFDVIETFEVSDNEIKLPGNIKFTENERVDVWLYSTPTYLGNFEVETLNGKTTIVGLTEALQKQSIEVGKHSIVMQKETGEKIGYMEVEINYQINKLNTDVTVPDGEIVNNLGMPEEINTGGQILAIVLVIIIVALAIVLVIVLAKNKKTKLMLLLLVLGSAFTFVKADKIINLPIVFNVAFESQNVMMKTECTNYDDMEYLNECSGYWYYHQHIKKIHVSNEMEPIENYKYSFDVSEKQNGSIMAYLVDSNPEEICYSYYEYNYYDDVNYEENYDETYCYDIYIQADGEIYANKDASYYYGAMLNLNNLDSLEKIHTDYVEDAEGMFYYTGAYSKTFNTDSISKLVTSNIVDMSRMFSQTGLYAQNLVFDFNDNFDTSKVTNMSYMFFNTGSNSRNFTLDLEDKFDTSKVTSMQSMFSYTGYNSPNFTLDLGDKFDTSKVTNMTSMFSHTGYHSPNFTLDLGDKFDTSKVTNMSHMFSNTGQKSSNFTLNLGDKFDTSEVTIMSYMFSNTGYNSPNFTLDLGDKFDTSKVTNMPHMFYYTGYNSSNFTLDLGDKFDTSKVTSMTNMFYNTGYKSTKFTLDLGDKFDTSEVTNMSNMFYNTGYTNPDFTLDLGEKFNTSKVTNMSYMFYYTGYNSTKLNLNITLRNKMTSTSYYSNMFKGVATKSGSKVTVNYTSNSASYIDSYINTKTSGANVVKGIQVD